MIQLLFIMILVQLLKIRTKSLRIDISCILMYQENDSNQLLIVFFLFKKIKETKGISKHSFSV